VEKVPNRQHPALPNLAGEGAVKFDRAHRDRGNRPGADQAAKTNGRSVLQMPPGMQGEALLKRPLLDSRVKIIAELQPGRMPV